MGQNQHVPGRNYYSEAHKQLILGLSKLFIQKPPLQAYGAAGQDPLNYKAHWLFGEALAQDPGCSKGIDPKSLRQLQEEKGVAGIVG